MENFYGNKTKNLKEKCCNVSNSERQKKMYYYFAQVTSKRFLLPFVTVVGIVTLVWQWWSLWPLLSLPLHYKLAPVTAQWTYAVMYNRMRVINPNHGDLTQPLLESACPSCRVTVWEGGGDLKPSGGGGTSIWFYKFKETSTARVQGKHRN